MGRVSILWSLLNKDYLPPSHLGTWFMDVCAKKRYDNGLETLVYYPILMMFAYAGKISYEDLVRSLYTRDLANSNTSKALIKGVNSSYLRNLVVHLIKGNELRLMSKPDTWNKELAILKGTMIRSFKAPNLDPPRLSGELAVKVFEALFPYFSKNTKIWDTLLQVQWSEVLSFEVDAKGILKDIFFDALSRNDIDIPMNYLRLSVDEILDLRDKAEQGGKVLSLLERTMETLTEQRPAKKLNLKSRISVVHDVLRMRKFVARWPHMKYESDKIES